MAYKYKHDMSNTCHARRSRYDIRAACTAAMLLRLISSTAADCSMIEAYEHHQLPGRQAILLGLLCTSATHANSCFEQHELHSTTQAGQYDRLRLLWHTNVTQLNQQTNSRHGRSSSISSNSADITAAVSSPSLHHATD
eukprot:GHUV01015443.1.p2 GENE.GHUV01015443.1~~GHUV01015443.1.p2  ORF type:complete len:139 (-),score=38.18 GHUV01015443.1:1065-1481(-)